MEKLIDRRYAVGVDLGGTFVKFALVADDGDVLYSNKLKIGSACKRDDILKTLHDSIRLVLNEAERLGVCVSGIGIGSPGIVCDGVVMGGADNLDGWENVPLQTIFSEAFDLPVFVDNDANVVGLAEVSFGAAKGCTDVVFITVGTGIGGAIVVNGDLYGGFKNRGGELGHIAVVHEGAECNCGGRGCLEVYASTTALIQRYCSCSGRPAEEVDGQYVVQKYLEREEIAVQCLEEHTNYLGHGIAAFVNIFAPQKIVIGGGISEAGQFYIDLISKSTFRYAMKDCAVNTEVVGAVLGNQAGSLGAASLVFHSKNVKLKKVS
ncbi:ROK family protein [Mangrovibacterium diazotrophicum]|uniref:Glucokinase n=1 Tax=Mangrovibacterium diazotrophicum TaxID=1261403 RepID=A0A419W4H9_9BACT|nr:ROK family protein [Mangrovibacterium diazotrophicum]RKD90371.1 glucokinase [Mangrovibacterium diazotrophicum]